MSLHLQKHHINSSFDHSFTGFTALQMLYMTSSSGLSGASDFYIGSSGNAYAIGISTPQASQKLSISGAVGLSGSLFLKAQTDATTPIQINPFSATQSNDLFQSYDSAGVKKVYIDSINRIFALSSISINTTLQNSALTVSGNSIFYGINTLTGSTRFSITTITTSYTATNNDYTLLFNVTGSVSCLLPSASTNFGAIFNIKKIDSSTGTINIITTSPDTIDGSSTGRLISTQYTSITVQSNNTHWYVI